MKGRQAVARKTDTHRESTSLRVRVRDGFTAFFNAEASGAVVLLGATVVALLLANSPFHLAYEHLLGTELGIAFGGREFGQSLLHWIDDALMALFFFVVGLEIKRELIAGELAERRKAALPILAAVGGMVVPAAIYLALNAGGVGVDGWGIPMATDIAFALGALALLGDRIPAGLRVFLAALAIADDIGAILVIALFYTEQVRFVWLGVVLVIFLALLAISRLGVDTPWPYALLGVALWGAMLASGVHATIAGVLVALTIPATAKLDPLEFSRRTRDAVGLIERSATVGEHTLVDVERATQCRSIRQDALHSMAPLQRMESALHPVTTFLILPLFALANAGVRLVGADLGAMLTSPVSLGIVLGLVIGKPLGIVALSWLALKLRLAELPSGVGWRHIAGAGVLGGIGFTMSLFVANLAFTDPSIVTPAKAAILLASVVAGIAGYTLLRSGRRASPAPRT